MSLEKILFFTSLLFCYGCEIEARNDDYKIEIYTGHTYFSVCYNKYDKTQKCIGFGENL